MTLTLQFETMLLLATALAVPGRSRITMRPTSQSRHGAVAYLQAESLQLSADFDALTREFEVIVERPFDRSAHAMWRRKLREFRGLLANHRLAWQWAQYPPCAVDARPLRCFCAIVAPPTDFPVTSAAASE